MMYILHYAPDNASMIIRLVMEEAGLPYRTMLVDRATRVQDSAAYRRLNPAGLIPAIETDSGPIFETGAILLWLSDRHGLGPDPLSPDRGSFLKWLFFLSNTAHADLRQLFYPDQYVPAEAIPAHHAILSARMKRHFGLLDQAVADYPGLFAVPSVLLVYVAALVRWSVLYPVDQKRWFHLSAYPRLSPCLAELEQRLAVSRVAASEGLGPTPFSAPSHPTPTEGIVF